MTELLDDLPPDELKRRLFEAEETLRAIRDGEADAVVVRAAEDDAIFALAGGDDSYRAIMEAMDTGAIALDAQEGLLYANAAFCALVGCAAADLEQSGLFAYLDAVSAKVVRDTIAQAESGRHQTQFVQTHKGRTRHLVVTAAPLPLAFGTGSALTFTDVTARIEAQAAEESARIGRAVMASANEAVIVCDREGRVINANAAVSTIADADPVGRMFEDAFPLDFPIGSGVMHPDELIAIANDGNAIKGLEASASFTRPPKDLLVSVAPLRLAGEAIGGSVITLIDLTERKTIEKRQSLLMRELDHRVKNTLTMVLSIGSRTIAGASDLSDFRHKFTSRIQALAATHNLLADAAWTGLGLAALIQTELAPYVSSAGPKLVMRGMDHSVSPDVGIAFGLVIHELATNAVKYGALSQESGIITVTGRQLDSKLFEVVWTESGGPAVVQPTKQGFGQTLIARSLKRGEGTGATVNFAPGGLICRLVFPIEA
ncbi:hypothetical protein ASE00_00915 [Sphingomonas sp. Root710]|uniref:sensor histidine kinase n=1 Tax=Sphingomonas sp. Root710 TaxID=1736594 RepID=UPI0006F2E186|nr:HWE histidine kinase domain-containing protein [Sphingomonas sp. Root710]KRB85395.1 hypothetical protein ASE00_00915 [Sphingomonas sp. Root710]